MLRTKVGAGTGVRFTPTLAFVLDKVPDTAAHMEELLARARQAPTPTWHGFGRVPHRRATPTRTVCLGWRTTAGDRTTARPCWTLRTPVTAIEPND